MAARLNGFLILALAAVATAAVLACGGDDEPAGGGTQAPADEDGDVGEELTVEAYFQQIDEIFARSDDELEALNTELGDATRAGTSLEDGVIAIDEFLEESVRVLMDAVDDIEVLNEPEEVRDEESAFIAAIRDGIDKSEALREDLEGVTDEQELVDLAQRFEEETARLTQQADEACFALQQIADENLVTVDLNCED